MTLDNASKAVVPRRFADKLEKINQSDFGVENFSEEHSHLVIGQPAICVTTPMRYDQ
jgi:hypothetical protein